MHTLVRYAVAPILCISVAGCTLDYFTSPPPDFSQAVLTFEDEFDGAVLDSAKWNIISRNIFYPGVLNAHNPDMLSVENGFLRIDLKAVPYLSMAYSGGAIDTRNKFNQRYGYFEARIKMPGGAGVHPAWWLWPQSDLWPPEIDVVETKGSQPRKAYMTVHWSENGVVRAYPEQVDFTGDHFAESVYEGPDFTRDFHVFGIEWNPDSLIWYIDGVERHRTAKHVPQEPFMLILDLTLDSYGGPLDSSTILPAFMLVDYVRVYRMGNGPGGHTRQK